MQATALADSITGNALMTSDNMAVYINEIPRFKALRDPLL